MVETIIGWLLAAWGIYLFCGFVFGVLFVWKGVGNIDPDARNASIGFRLIILPGVAVFWPIFIRRWRSQVSTPPSEKTAHKRSAS